MTTQANWILKQTIHSNHFLYLKVLIVLLSILKNNTYTVHFLIVFTPLGWELWVYPGEQVTVKYIKLVNKICQCDFVYVYVLETMYLHVAVWMHATVYVYVHVLLQSVSVLTPLSHAENQSQGVLWWALLITPLCMIPIFNPGNHDSRAVRMTWEIVLQQVRRVIRGMKKVVKVTQGTVV